MANRGRRAARPEKGGCSSLKPGQSGIDSRKHVRSAKGKSGQCLVTNGTYKNGKPKIVRGRNGLAMHKPSCTVENGKLIKVSEVSFCSTRKMASVKKRAAAAKKRRAAKPRKRTTTSTAACISKSTGNKTIPKLSGACKKGSTKKYTGTTTTGPRQSRPMPANFRCQKGGKFVGKLKSGKCPAGAKTVAVKKRGAANRRKASANFVCQSKSTKKFTRRTANGQCRQGSKKIRI